MKLNGKLIDALAILIFIALTFVFFGRLYSGDVLQQTDIQQYGGMSKEIVEYRANGENIHWTNSAFSGMPTYLLGDSLYRSQNLPQSINYAIRSVFPGVSAILLIAFICFYILMRALKVNRWLSVIGSFCFGAGTFVIASLLAGHTSKINAFAYAPLIVAGLVYIFRRKPWAGVFLLGYGLAAQIAVNHLQITFYTFLICLIFVISELIIAIKNKEFDVWKPIIYATLGVILGLGVNYNKLYTIYQHAKFTTRSAESLKQSTEQGNSKDNKYDYATQWSHTPLESFTLLIPNFMGGASNEKLGEKSSWYGQQGLPQYYQTNPPTYWGQMPFTGGPVYLGAVLFALFFFALQYTSGRTKWWAIVASILLLMLAWGKFSPIYDIFYHHFPFFNKFRTPMMALLLLSLTIPLVAFKGVQNAITSTKKITNKQLLIGFGIPMAIILLFGMLGAGMYSFTGAVDQGLQEAGLPNNLLKLLRSDRQRLLMNDSIRSLIFVLLTAGATWAYANKKMNQTILIVAIALLSFIDLFMVNKRYLNADLYASKAQYEQQLNATVVDKNILQDKSIYRVLDLSNNPFNNAITSYHHKSIGGYHAAKLQSYQDLIDFKLSRNDISAINMLNAKYLIGTSENGQIGLQENENAYGNVWFVSNLEKVDNKREEMAQLSAVNLKETALLGRQGFDVSAVKEQFNINGSNITLTSYHPEKMVYKANANGNQFAVFSEIFYKQKDGDGWHATIDGQEVPLYRVDYLLRGIEVPNGEHEIVFSYQKSAFQSRGFVSMIFSGLLLLVALAYGWGIFTNINQRVETK